MNNPNKTEFTFIDAITTHPISFALIFLLIIVVTVSTLYFSGFVPNELQNNAELNSFFSLDYVEGSTEPIPSEIQAGSITKGKLPERIVIPGIGVDSTVSNPDSTKVSVLDTELLKGAVRYPGSGLLGKGNLFIFGHSTSIRVVRNQAYKTFNGLGTLKEGDTIEVYSSKNKYVYAVKSVTLKNEDRAKIDLSITKPTLTLSTCNTFGKKQERFVVLADLVSSSPI